MPSSCSTPPPFGVRVRLAYDGREFAGWQHQPGQRTVQDTLRAAVAALDPRHGVLRGASRTDSGVHAEGQVAAFATHRQLDPRGWVLALNQHLPDDVAVHEAAPCPPRYDPRFDAIDKRYRYLLHVGPQRHPLLRHDSWHLGHLLPSGRVRPDRSLDLDAMAAACQQLEGSHDFRAFQSMDDVRQDTRRHMERVVLLRSFGGRETLVAIEVQGKAFLKQMVRIMVGTLVEVGRGKRTPDDVARLLGGDHDRRAAGPTAPAHGLTLVSIRLGRAAHEHA